MGDADGPAYCVYSKIGYNRASIDILLSELRHNLYRESDMLPLTAYIFLGVDIYDANGQWVNCFDAGLGFHNGKQKWTLFHNILKVPPTQDKWYMSRVNIWTIHTTIASYWIPRLRTIGRR